MNNISIKKLKNYKLVSVFLVFFVIGLLPKILIAQPIPLTKDSRIKDLVYDANTIYNLKFHHGYQSFIEFSDNEEMEMISIGESFSWRLIPNGRRLFIKPLEIAAHTNMTVITNKRTYLFNIRSDEYTGKADEELAHVVRFYYPDIKRSPKIPEKLTRPNIPKKDPNFKGRITTPLVPLDVTKKLPKQLQFNAIDAKVNFKYSVVGEADSINPLKIYNDNKNTYFQFKNNNLVVPRISSVNVFGEEKTLGYFIKDNYVVVPTVENQFTLRLADSLLCIFNDDI